MWTTLIVKIYPINIQVLLFLPGFSFCFFFQFKPVLDLILPFALVTSSTGLPFLDLALLFYIGSKLSWKLASSRQVR